MNAREKILSAVRDNKPSLVPMPELTIDRHPKSISLLDEFSATLTRIGGTPVIVRDMNEVSRDIEIAFQAGDHIVNTIDGLSDVNRSALLGSDATTLEPVFKAYIQGTMGVAENGSIWLYESSMVNRLLPFICQHLVIVLRAENIVSTMHDAYRTIDTARDGYGLFLAGPSKTADIEQSLVIGAHGARSLRVFLVLDN
jgi:L-lactate dehydrogenase complex protein LldG